MMVGFVAFVIVFNVLIFVHELGHFATAKLAGVRVEEFGFGYPPRLLQIGSWRGTKITLNALPLGGFVRMFEDDPTVEGSLANKSRRVRATVFFAGAAMNLVLAIVLYSVTFMLGALTPVEHPGAGIYYVAPRSPAQAAGIQPGDNIVSVAGLPIQDTQQTIDIIQANLGQPVTLILERDGETLSPIVVTPRSDPPPNEGAVGISLGLPLERRAYPFFEAVPLGLRATWNTIRGMYFGLKAALTQQMPFQISGPIGIYQTTSEVAKTGLERLIEFTAFLSLNLFLVNLLPLPALDGGRLIFIALELIRGGRRVPPEKEGLVHAIGMLVLVSLMVVVTFFDYQRYFG